MNSLAKWSCLPTKFIQFVEIHQNPLINARHSDRGKDDQRGVLGVTGIVVSELKIKKYVPNALWTETTKLEWVSIHQNGNLIYCMDWSTVIAAIKFQHYFKHSKYNLCTALYTVQ